MRRSLRAAVLLATVGTLAACTSEPPPATPAPATSASPAVPSTPSAAPSPAGGSATVGLKWNWGQQGTLSWASQRPAGGITFYEIERCDVAGSGETPNFDRIDRIVERAQALGYRIMLKFRVGGTCGSEASLDRAEGVRKVASRMPADLPEYERFVEEAVRHYSAMGVDSYAVENEVDAKNFWRDTPENYVALATATARAIRRADPRATILDSGISSTGLGVAMAAEVLAEGRAEDALQLYQSWYSRRVQGSTSRFPKVTSVDELKKLLASPTVRRVVEMVDANWKVVRSGDVTAYQLHFYEGSVNLSALLDYLRGHLPQGMPVQGWEIGIAWPGSTFDQKTMADEVAALMTRLYSEEISPVVFLPLAFTPGPDKEQIFRGLISPTGEPYPAAAAYAAVADVVTGAELRSVQGAGWAGVAATRAGSTKVLVTRLTGAGEGQLAGGATGTSPVSGSPVTGPVSPGQTVVLDTPTGEDPQAAVAAALGSGVSVR